MVRHILLQLVHRLALRSHNASENARFGYRWQCCATDLLFDGLVQLIAQLPDKLPTITALGVHYRWAVMYSSGARRM